MPATSAAQQRPFGLALAVKRGKKVKAGDSAKRIAKTMSAGKIKEFASTRGFTNSGSTSDFKL